MSHTYCDSCNVGCESENTCNFCNECQLCNEPTCEEECILVQAFCEIKGQDVGGFSFGQCVSSDQTFLTKANWNRLITYINNAYAEGEKCDGGPSGLPASDSNEFMTADMFNKVSNALGGLGSSGPGYSMTGGPSGDIIYGTYFETLEQYANNLLYNSDQCDLCNEECDVTCKECQLCNEENCGRCNGSCQDHSPNYDSSCESGCEVSCQSDCQVSCQSETPSA